MSSTQVLDVIMNRRSIRFFKQDPIPKDVLMKILSAGIRAPTAGGAQQWFFIVVENAELRRKIHKLLLEAHEIYARKALRESMPVEKVNKWLRRIEEGMYLAPLYIAAYIDLRERRLRDELKEYEKLMAIHSLAAAIENMIIAAHSLGLGCVWLGVPLLIRGKFDELLKPPEGCELQAIIALGYPAEEPKLRSRKPLEEVVKFM